MDTKSSQDIFDIFAQLNNKDGLTIVVTTYNTKLGSQAKRIILLQDGMIIPEK